MSSFENVNAILGAVQADTLESYNPFDAEFQDLASIFDMEGFSNDFGPRAEGIAATNDALFDELDYSLSASSFAAELDASLDAYGHVDPYYATGVAGPASVAPAHPAPEDILTAPPVLPHYGDAYGVYNQVTNEWRGLSGQETIYVHPLSFVPQQELHAAWQEVPPAEDETVWVPEPVEPHAWQVPNPDPTYWQGLPEPQTMEGHPFPAQVILQQNAWIMAQDTPVVPELQDGVVLVSEPFEPQGTAVEPPTRPCKRKARQTDDEIWPRPPKKTKCAYDDPYPPHPNTHSSSCPVPTPSSSSLSCSSPSSLSPLSSSAAMSLSPEELSLLSPIVVEPPNGFYCPMPGCGVPLPAKDSAWRSHFRRAHHKELCADARAGSCTGNCKYPCPLPKGDDDEYTCTTPMLVESIGRHFLNVHLGLRHQCPVCGLVDAWRFFACKRHIPVCPTLKAAKKEGETSTREGATPAKKEGKKPTKKPRGRKVQRRQ